MAPVERTLRSLRHRAWLVLGARALVAGVGALVASVALGSLVVGPLGGTLAIAVVWLVAIGLSASAALWALDGTFDLRGAEVARLYRAIDPGLVSRARTALVLERQPTEDAIGKLGSPALARAHVAATARALAAIPIHRVLPWRAAIHPASQSAALGLAIGVALLLASPRAAGGLFAVLHPAAREVEGASVAAVFSEVDARVVFPAYQAREALEVRGFGVLTVPAGATVEIRARSRVPLAAGEAVLEGTAASLETDPGGVWVARFVVREGGPLTLRARTEEGQWALDATAREVRVVADAPPIVSLTEPDTDLTVELEDEVVFDFRAGDDVALSEVSLVIQAADGREVRRRIEGLAPGAREHAGRTTLRIAELAPQPGDRITAHVEARDTDDVAGPNVGRSVSRTLTLASEATRREEGIAELEAIAVQCLDLLADRLESPSPADASAAPPRFARLRAGTEALSEALARFSVAVESRPGFRATDAPIYREMGNRIRRLGFEERRLHEPTLAELPLREDLDRRARAELEEDVLRLEDLLLRARAEDAAAIARELEALRREIASLLAELRRADTPEARAEILAAIARAEQRLSDLRARLGAMMHASPGDFANAEATEAEAEDTADALARLREAIERGDLDEAGRALVSLEQEIDALADAVGGAGESMGEETFGARDRALAEAIDALMGLESEERELARRSGETRTNAARRAVAAVEGDVREAADRLGERTAEAAAELDGIDGRRLAMVERETLDTVRARLNDARIALSHGDLGEASRMTEEAERSLDDLSRDLDLDAMMFPGHDGETSEASRAARRAGRAVEDLRRDIEAAIPDLLAHLDEGERARMREDVPRQSGAADAAARLSELLAHGTDGTPISPEGAMELETIEHAMREAHGALERGDVAEASRNEDEAARRLTELREQLEQDASASSSGGGGSRNDLSGEVRIPGTEEFSGSMDLRRRLLDGMREGAPSGWEDPVRRYYEELLR